MTTKAQSAKGVRLGVEATIDGTTKTWYFDEVKAVPEIGETPARIDVTHLTSDAHEYIKDIPDYSADLTFSMNAQPYINDADAADAANLNLIRALNKNGSYWWVVEYPAHNVRIRIYGDWSYAMGAASVSSPVDINLTIIPRGAPIMTPYSDVTVTVSYDANGGTGTMQAQQDNLGTTFTIEDNTFTPPTDKIFGAWNTASDGTGQAYDERDTITPTGNVTLYAIWVNDSS